MLISNTLLPTLASPHPTQSNCTVAVWPKILKTYPHAALFLLLVIICFFWLFLTDNHWPEPIFIWFRSTLCHTQWPLSSSHKPTILRGQCPTGDRLAGSFSDPLALSSLQIRLASFAETRPPISRSAVAYEPSAHEQTSSFLTHSFLHMQEPK